MKIAIFSPNLTRNAGGAETYALGLANALSKEHTIVIYALKPKEQQLDIVALYSKYGSKVFETRYVNYIITGSHEILKGIGYYQLHNMKREISKEFDLFINSAFGRLRAPAGIRSIHIIHFPDKKYSDVFPTWIGKILDRNYIDSYDLFLCNSDFTKEHFRRIWKHEPEVLNPPISMTKIESDAIESKENIILAVDRLVHDKRVDLLIDAFLKFKTTDKGNYRFMIVGNSDKREMEYYKQIKERADQSESIEIKSNVSFDELKNIYMRAKLFWHAKGYDVGEDAPEKMEHFGMTTVEAMANGVVPVVINKAGQKEIIKNGKTGYKWDTISQLLDYTTKLANDKDLLEIMRDKALCDIDRFLMPAFEAKVKSYINRLL